MIKIYDNCGVDVRFHTLRVMLNGLKDAEDRYPKVHGKTEKELKKSIAYFRFATLTEIASIVEEGIQPPPEAITFLRNEADLHMQHVPLKAAADRIEFVRNALRQAGLPENGDLPEDIKYAAVEKFGLKDKSSIEKDWREYKKCIYGLKKNTRK